MARAWTREGWNGIIRRINGLAEDCSFGDPLEEVPEGHVWSVDDITIARNKLMAFCTSPPPTFSVELVKWSQALIDELNDAIDDCECGCTQALVDDMRSLHGLPCYIPYGFGNIRFTKTEWFGADDHWHFQWVYRADYDFTLAMGMGYGQAGLSGIGATCKFRLEWWHWPSEGPMQFHSSEEEIGTVETNCEGLVTAAPSGTYVKAFPADYQLLDQPIGSPFTRWDTEGAACC